MWVEKIKGLAKNRGITIKDLAVRIDMSEANLYKVFKRKSIETKYLQKIADVLSVPISYFFDDNQSDDKKNINVNGVMQIGSKNSNNNDSASLEACKKELDSLKHRLKDKEEIIELLKGKKS
jgi:transcriptional regulator with XRE-family HTH domain